MFAVIFDLDLTLVDSSKSEQARSRRDWTLVYSLIPSFSIYPGIPEVFDYIREKKIKVAIVSTAPRTYIERVVNYFSIPCDCIVGYHDAKPIKPHPAPMLKALCELNTSSQNTISFGDRRIDILSSNSANIKSVACLWGTKEKDLLVNSSPWQIIESPLDIIPLLG